VEGFARIDESDLMAIPDVRTFRIIPWEIAGQKVAMMFCDIEKYACVETSAVSTICLFFVPHPLGL